MRVNELVQTGTRTEYRDVIIPAEYDNNGEIVSDERVETAAVAVPVMEVVYRDATPAEEAEAAEEAARFAEYERTRPRTVEERVDAIDNADTGELAEIRAALVELADIVMGG